MPRSVSSVRWQSFSLKVRSLTSLTPVPLSVITPSRVSRRQTRRGGDGRLLGQATTVSASAPPSDYVFGPALI